MTNVLAIGAGTMGTQIALYSAMNGCRVTIYDVKADILETSVKNMRTYLAGLTGIGVFTGAQCEEILQRITATADPQEAGKDADIVSESVPEDPVLKGKVFAQFNAICPPEAIFTTNTSTLVPSMYAEATGRAEKFAAMHFHPPIWENKIVDIAPHPKTSPETMEALQRFARGIGLIPIVLEKEHHSYVFNNMLNGLLGAATSLVVGEVASFQDVDRAWMGVMHTQVGPFGIMDYIGLDTIYTITKYWAEKSGYPDSPAVKHLEKFMQANELGVKTGKGYYKYPDPEYAQEGFVR